jgi:hypothetical protein
VNAAEMISEYERANPPETYIAREMRAAMTTITRPDNFSDLQAGIEQLTGQPAGAFTTPRWSWRARMRGWRRLSWPRAGSMTGPPRSSPGRAAGYPALTDYSAADDFEDGERGGRLRQ